MEGETGFGREPRLKHLLDLFGGRVGRGEANASANAQNVSVNWNYRPTKREQENTRSRLRTHAGERLEVGAGFGGWQAVEEVEAQAAVAGPQALKQGPDSRRLHASQATRSNRLDKFDLVGGQNIFPSWEERLKASEGTAGIRVGGVLRENRCHQLGKRIANGSADGLPIEHGKSAVNGSATIDRGLAGFTGKATSVV